MSSRWAIACPNARLARLCSESCSALVWWHFLGVGPSDLVPLSLSVHSGHSPAPAFPSAKPFGISNISNLSPASPDHTSHHSCLRTWDGHHSEAMNCFMLGMISSPFLGPFPNAFAWNSNAMVQDPSWLFSSQPFAPHFIVSSPNHLHPKGSKSAWCQLYGELRKKEMAPDLNKIMPSVLQDLSLLSQLQRNFYFVGNKNNFWGDRGVFVCFLMLFCWDFCLVVFVFYLSSFQECQRC